MSYENARTAPLTHTRLRPMHIAVEIIRSGLVFFLTLGLVTESVFSSANRMLVPESKREQKYRWHDKPRRANFAHEIIFQVLERK